ncbi:hypothetical protein [Flavimaricola marinus]|uniref:DUF4149 domain-containing protein n=1 Tax=Flavimaricola marinus TaxID=1819565 RepID=A0A238LHN6_9RHOB|nr:hypothetical protein [Flavimaricola marinus]SMY08466.1 hypothetical protein LOM8899_02618 [Flavimaricola marinus]
MLSNGMSRGWIFWAIFAGWAGLMGLSVIVPMSTAPTDFGFTKGMNRISLFFQYQLAATALAILLLLLARSQTTRLRVWLARLPAIVVALQVLALGALIGWARFGPHNTGPTDIGPPGSGPVQTVPKTEATD